MKADTLLVGNLSVARKDGVTHISAPVSPPSGAEATLPKELAFDISSPAAVAISEDRMDAFALALLIPAVERGWNLHIAGRLCPVLLDAINSRIVPVLNKHFDLDKTIVVTADAAAPPLPAGTRSAATGFSGGVDSFYTLHLYSGQTAPALSVKYLMFNDVGQFGKNTVWRDFSFGITQRAAQALHLSLIRTYSNLDRFYRAPFLRSHTLRNIAVAHLFQASMQTFLYSSSYPISTVDLTSDAISLTEPILVPQCSSASLRCIPTGGGSRRVDKVSAIAAQPESHNHLFVCIDGQWTGSPINCSRCSKCTRTIMLLHALNRGDLYRKVFDATWAGERLSETLIRFVATARSSYLAGYRELARQNGVAVPIAPWIKGQLFRALFAVSPPGLRWRLRKWLPSVYPF